MMMTNLMILEVVPQAAILLDQVLGSFGDNIPGNGVKTRGRSSWEAFSSSIARPGSSLVK